ncbi:hypothetical protein G4H71_21085 [Rhodococcus triatomae]|uniref:Uncharacterized protein n=1 Tax=Rhodococcus triatomae TaxID=300028 RepID=A0A1G8KC84_9NOCA|nr:hypothetical protein [Rhodococcus triatomae]QNG18880.1 hypothetical protein G4H72_09295 [Rhodococcus triatomae]QNG25208.1 hypothetical protein G4H71_21085 [Rhodococcus triatomae]SDI41021.1 hypothetical protein SAMN05444695_10791 [Rhodococcus triatomae]
MSTDTAKPAAAPVSAPKDVVADIEKFLAAHGGSGSAVVQPVGEGRVRITLVGEDGILGDQVVPDLVTANAVVEAVSGLTEAAGWDRELTSKVTPRPGHFAQMAGWVARQTRFPKARNER